MDNDLMLSSQMGFPSIYSLCRWASTAVPLPNRQPGSLLLSMLDPHVSGPRKPAQGLDQNPLLFHQASLHYQIYQSCTTTAQLPRQPEFLPLHNFYLHEPVPSELPQGLAPKSRHLHLRAPRQLLPLLHLQLLLRRFR